MNVLSRGTMRWSTIAVVAAALLAAALIGILQASIPFIGPAFVIGCLAAPIVVTVDPEWQIIAILVVLVLSRVLMLIGAPSLISYAHFGLLVLLLASLLMRHATGRDALPTRGNALLALVTLLAIVTVISALVGRWHALRPCLEWLTLAEPFVVLSVIVAMNDTGRNRVRMTLIALALLQLPFALYQFLQSGAGDNVKGTLIAQGAGHHILGALGVLGAMLAIERGATTRSMWAWGVVAAPLFCLGLLSDAKQVYGALAASAAVFALPLLRARSRAALVAAVVVVCLAYVGPKLDSSFDTTFSLQHVQENLDQKTIYYPLIAAHLDLPTIVLGDGPGNGLSRVAMLTLPSYGTVPEFLVGSSPAPLASLIDELDTKRSVTQRGASTSSPYNSMVGIFTDLGIAGCIVYAALGIASWRILRISNPFDRNLGKMLILMALILGMLFTWLEEPVYMVFLASVVGVLAAPVDTKHAEVLDSSDTDWLHRIGDELYAHPFRS